MKDLTLRKLVICCIAFAMGLVTLCGLAAALASWSYYEYGMSTFADTGFSVMGFRTFFIEDGGFEWATTLMGVFAILQLVVAVAALVLSVLALFVFKGKTAYSICKSFVVTCFCFLIWYMIEGIVYSSIAGGYYIGLTTLAYVPLIFGVLLFVAYFVCVKMLPEKPLRKQEGADGAGQAAPFGAQQQYAAPAQQYGAPAQQYGAQPQQYGMPAQPQSAVPAQPAPAPSVSTVGAEMAECAKLLVKYKELLDQGVITQEEFDTLKAELLGKK